MVIIRKTKRWNLSIRNIFLQYCWAIIRASKINKNILKFINKTIFLNSIVEQLLELGADINQRDTSGKNW